MSIPSRHQLGQHVALNFGLAGIVLGEVCGIKFRDGMVFYDVKVFPFPDEPENNDLFVILQDVRGFYVEEPIDRFKKPEANGFNGLSNVGLKLNEN